MGPLEVTSRSLLKFLFLFFNTFQLVHSFPAVPFRGGGEEVQDRRNVTQDIPVGHSKREFLFDDLWCPNADMRSAIQYSIDEAQQVLSGAANYLGAIETFLGGSGALDLCGQADDFQEAFRMFETLYGQIYFGEGQDANNAAGAARVSFVKHLVSQLLSRIQNPYSFPAFQISCGDFNVWAYDFDYLTGTQYYAPYYYDAAASSIALVPSLCAADANTKGYSLNNHVTLCPAWFSQWTTDLQSGKSWTAMQTGSYELTDYMSIDVLERSLTFTLLHEFTHNNALTTVTYWLEDQDCPGGASKAYGWECCIALGQQSPDLAVKNPDNLALYLAALYVRKYYWFTGFVLSEQLFDWALYCSS